MKRTVLAAALACILPLSSCAGMLDAEYVAVTKHAVVSSDYGVEKAVLTCSDRASMRGAIEAVVITGGTLLQLKFSDYNGDIARDLNEVCVEVPRELAEAAYRVNYITFDLNYIVSYYEADVTVVYKHPERDLRSIRAFDSVSSLRSAIVEAAVNHSPGFAFWSDGTVSSDDISGIIEESYYSDCVLPYIPEAELSFYPAENVRSIVELSLTYPYSAEESSQRMKEINAAVGETVYALGGERGDNAIVFAANRLNSRIEYDSGREESGDYSRWYNVYTAYGALVQRKAVGEGFALAMKMVMNAVGVDCMVVRGMRSGVPHAWNLVRCGNGSWYHIDVSTLPEGVIFFTEKELSSSYRYDAAAYPVSLGPSLQPAAEPEPLPEAEAPDEPEEELPDDESSEETGGDPSPETPDEPEEASPGEDPVSEEGNQVIYGENGDQPSGQDGDDPVSSEAEPGDETDTAGEETVTETDPDTE